MIRAAILIVLIACGRSLSADDSATEPQTNPKDIARLLERIRDLEKRVSQLEASANQTAPIAPLPQPPPQPPQYHAPGYYPHVAPGPYTPNGRPYSAPPVPNATLAPPAAPDSNVPKTWKPFYFNGQWYYMVPCDEAPAGMERSGRKATEPKDAGERG